ncbi:uncharacterized protein Dmoj_GI14865 [Drosophila mojavensis]|uniref:Uncharacterized protein n=1 Tax=Drosophila mojavensis TaxID=7230 RepID=B4L4G9_DROMO|nr:uncharacterized protein Dmoj_GI14865 [Drosophila mojavensis]
MVNECAEDMPFNPFYVGPHPSQACTRTEPAVENVRQCSPISTDTKCPAVSAPGPQSNSSQAAVSQTSKGKTPATPAAAPAAPAAAPCGPYPCNDVRK